jgi:hypothetical protein
MICQKCKRDVPIERFATTPKGRRARRCSGCKRHATTSVKRWHKKGRECARCGQTVPCPEQITDFPWRETAICKPCIKAKARARCAEWAREKVAADDEFRQRRIAASRRWQARNPDAVYAAERRRWDKVRADPERYARAKEDARMRYRLRRERAGSPSKPLSEATYLRLYGTGVSKARSKLVPVEPLLPLLSAAVELHGEVAVARASGVPERRLFDLLHRRSRNVSIISADKLCVYLDHPFSLVYAEHTWPEERSDLAVSG